MAIEQSQQIDEVQDTMVRALKRLAKADRSNESADLQSALDQSLERRAETADLLELADRFNQISSLGEAERKACLQILDVFVNLRKTVSSPFRFH